MTDTLKKLRRVWFARIVYREMQELYPNGVMTPKDLHHYSGIPLMYCERGLAELKRLGLAEEQPVTGWFLTDMHPVAVEPARVKREYQLEKPGVEPPKKKRKAKNPELQTINPNHAIFIAQWTSAYEKRFGQKYIFNGKDGAAAKLALESKLSPEQLMSLATEAWEIGEKKPWNYVLRNSIDLMNFATTLNKIQAELAIQRPKPVQPVPAPAPAAPEEPKLQLPGHKFSYTVAVGPALEDWEGHPDAEAEYQIAEQTWRQWKATQK